MIRTAIYQIALTDFIPYIPLSEQYISGSRVSSKPNIFSYYALL